MNVNPALLNGNHSEASVGMQRRDFSGVSSTRENSATAALAAKAKAEAEARYLYAMHRPRSLAQVRAALLKECSRPAFAQAAIWNKPVGNGLEGLSIRFAEAAARAYGNLSMETAQIYDDERTRVVRITVTDLETNTPWSQDVSVDKLVERKHLRRGQVAVSMRANTYGDQVYVVEATEDELAVKQAAAQSKALRTLILRCIPGDLQDEAFAACKRTIADESARDPQAARNALCDGFARLGVQPVQLEAWLGHTLDSISDREFNALRGIGVALRDGETSWDAVMEVRREKLAASEDRGGAPLATVGRGTAATKERLRRSQVAPAPVAVEVPVSET